MQIQTLLRVIRCRLANGPGDCHQRVVLCSNPQHSPPLGASLQVTRLLLEFGTGEEGGDERGHAGLPAWEPALLVWQPVPRRVRGPLGLTAAAIARRLSDLPG